MSNNRLEIFQRTPKTAFGLSALVAVAALAVLFTRGREGAASKGALHERAAPIEKQADPPATSGAASALTSADHQQPAPARTAPTARTARDNANAEAPTRTRTKSELTAQVNTFLDYATSYKGDDRAKQVDESLAKVVAGGARSVFEIQRQLGDATVYEQAKRAAAFHALERIGQKLANSSDAQAQQALLAIQSMAKSELALPSLIEPDPQLEVETLPQSTRDELLHQGILVERDGELLQPTALNKLPVIRMLRSIGGEMSRDRLKQLAAAPDNPPGVQLAAEHATKVASR